MICFLTLLEKLASSSLCKRTQFYVMQCSQAPENLVSFIDVSYDYVSSDHKPILFTLSEVRVPNHPNCGVVMCSH
jgi:hypothetical protein